MIHQLKIIIQYNIYYNIVIDIKSLILNYFFWKLKFSKVTNNKPLSLLFEMLFLSEKINLLLISTKEKYMNYLLQIYNHS